MPSEIRRIVTGVDDNGTSVVHDREPVPAREIGLMPGAQFFQVWGTEGALSSPATTPKAENATFFPGPGGTRFGLLTFPPEPSSAAAAAPDEEALANLGQQAEVLLPGLLGVFEPDAPGMHQTATVDYAIVVSGELYLELDDGVEVHLPTGSTVVQNGARHAWRNHSKAPATLAYVILGT
jgi:quercetin dioxygenase-like cupin family protein